MFNKDVVSVAAISAAMAFCMFSTLIAVAVALGLVPYSVLPYGLLGSALGVILFLCKFFIEERY